MFFSFLVPVYNVEKYLDKCMESLLCQKGADFEIVLLDDGSTDNSGEICDRYAKEYPDIVRVIHKENEGLLMTRRRGFKEAKGDWFICVDSDDYIKCNLLEKLVETIHDHSPDMVIYNYEYFDDNGVVSRSGFSIEDESMFSGNEKEKIYTLRLLTDHINSMCMKAIKREVVDIDADYSNCGIRNMCEDAVQSLSLLTNAKKIVCLNIPLYCYRKGQESITANRTYNSWISSKSCFLETEKYLDVWEIPDELQKKFYTHYVEHLSNFLRWAFSQSEDRLEKSLEEIIKYINTHPSFTNCMNMYDKKYAKTSYLKLSVPIIMKYVQKENINGLRSFFALESRVLPQRKK